MITAQCLFGARPKIRMMNAIGRILSKYTKPSEDSFTTQKMWALGNVNNAMGFHNYNRGPWNTSCLEVHVLCGRGAETCSWWWHQWMVSVMFSGILPPSFPQVCEPCTQWHGTRDIGNTAHNHKHSGFNGSQERHPRLFFEKYATKSTVKGPHIP